MLLLIIQLQPSQSLTNHDPLSCFTGIHFAIQKCHILILNLHFSMLKFHFLKKDSIS